MSTQKANPLRPILTADEINQLRPFGEEQRRPDGNVLFRERIHSETFFIIIEGQIRASRSVAGQDLLLAMHQPGGFTGEISLLSGEESLATGVAVGELRALHVPASRFPEAMIACPELMTRILPVLARRVPAILGLQTEREKLAALGQLAAGFAHELNNPASAVNRGAALLQSVHQKATSATAELLRIAPNREQVAVLEALSTDIYTRPCLPLNPLERADAEEELAARLAAEGLADPWTIASNLTDAGLRGEDLDRLDRFFSAVELSAVLTWLAATASINSLLHDIHNAAGRISDLVLSIKNYSFVDQAPVQEIDVHAGLDSTLRMLEPTLRQKSITVVRPKMQWQLRVDVKRITERGSKSRDDEPYRSNVRSVLS